MNIEGWYYLHTNGDLIFKRDYDGVAADIRESDFARALWPVDASDREGAWTILIEALAAGATKQRISELAAKWHCSDEDAEIYADRVGARVFKDGAAWCATRKDFDNLQESPAGFGDTALEALAALAKELGYQPAKMWGASFKQLLRIERSDLARECDQRAEFRGGTR
jgi:hypothetical protein